MFGYVALLFPSRCFGRWQHRSSRPAFGSKACSPLWGVLHTSPVPHTSVPNGFRGGCSENSGSDRFDPWNERSIAGFELANGPFWRNLAGSANIHYISVSASSRSPLSDLQRFVESVTSNFSSCRLGPDVLAIHSEETSSDRRRGGDDSLTNGDATESTDFAWRGECFSTPYMLLGKPWHSAPFLRFTSKNRFKKEYFQYEATNHTKVSQF